MQPSTAASAAARDAATSSAVSGPAATTADQPPRGASAGSGQAAVDAASGAGTVHPGSRRGPEPGADSQLGGPTANTTPATGRRQGAEAPAAALSNQDSPSARDRQGEASTGGAAGAGAVVPRRAAPAPKRFVRQQVPDDILNNAQLNAAASVLPANYNFEVHKTVWRLRQAGARRVALQFPEGLLMYACVLADIFESFAGCEECVVMGDVTFGACCVDDFSAAALGCDFLVHYGHSCLVPVDVTSVPAMYVFVDIAVDVDHLVASLRLNFARGTALALAGTIQFASSIQAARAQLAGDFPALAVPQARPLSPGEVLGCTAPAVPPGTQAIVFVADGRFHLEAIMITNPTLPAYRYDPYARELTREEYDQAGMRAQRRAAVEAARSARRWGLVLGTLGRQGNPRTLDHIQRLLAARGLPHTVVLLSEVSPAKLALIGHVEAWVQVACPRLSIDWGEGFALPTLTPYEALVALGEVPGWWEAPGATGGGADAYPMDYYAKDGGVWNSNWHRTPAARPPRRPLGGPPAAPAAASVAAA